MQTILVCEDSFEGILTGIYEAYERKLPHDDVIIETGGEENFRLFSEYIEIKADEEKAVKVSRSLRRMLGDEVVYDLHNALASEDTERGNAYRQLSTIVSRFGVCIFVGLFLSCFLTILTFLKCTVQWH